MENRDAINLANGPVEIFLANNLGIEYRYKVNAVLSDKGASCICYLAEKYVSEIDSKIVVLKEFYPLKYSDWFWRNDEGGLGIDDENNEVVKEYYEHIDTINRLCEYVKDEKYREIRKYLCVDDDIEPLFATNVANGLPTVYCENMYIGTHYWKTLTANNSKVSLSQILQTSIAVIDFLRKFHEIEPGWAYVDIKPEDILIGNSEIDGTCNYSDVLFYDFESNKVFGTYDCKEIKITYIPKYLSQSNQVEIGVVSENCTFAKAITTTFGERERNKIINEISDTQPVLDVVKQILKADRPDEGVGKMTEKEIADKLEDIKDQLERDERKIKENRKLPIYDFMYKMLCGSLVVFYLILSWMIYDAIKGAGIAQDKFIEWFLIIALMFCLIFLDVFLVYVFVQKYSYLKVSLNYYDSTSSCGKIIRNKEYNTFRLGKSRKDTTLIDESELHKSQQKNRRIWWNALVFFILIVGVALCIYVKKLPMFFIIGIPFIIAFMRTDYLQACKRDFGRYTDFLRFDCQKYHGKNEFYKTYCNCLSEDELAELDIQKAIFYGDEYIRTCKTGAFEKNNDFYYKKDGTWCRDIYRFREWVLKEGYNNDKEPKIRKRIKGEDKYDAVMEKLKNNQKSKIADLRYTSLHMQQIYKMTFDRIKNENLIIELIILTGSLLLIAFVGLFTYKERLALTCVPNSLYNYVIYMLLIITGGAHIYMSLRSKNRTRIEAEAAFKSRFVDSRIDTSVLNELLQRDIAAGFIQPIDIERGTTRYQSSVISRVTGETESTRRNKIAGYEIINRPLLQYKEVARRRQLAISMFCAFFFAFSIFVWMLKIYWMLLPLIILTGIIQLTCSKYVIPKFEKKKIVNTIENIIRKTGNTE